MSNSNFVVYNWNTGKKEGRPFKLRVSAQARANKLNWEQRNVPVEKRVRYKVCTVGAYNSMSHDVKLIVMKNIMSGKEFISRVDTNFATTPASETYWSS